MWARVTSDQGLLQKTGLTGVNPPGDIVPRVQFSDTYQNWSDETKNKGQQVNNTLQFADTLAMYRGNHSLKFGADMRWQQTNGADSAGQQGIFGFNPNETALPTAAGRATSGNAFASFLLGAVDNSSYNGLFVVPGIRYQYKALFAQDDWKVSRKLTLNLGLALGPVHAARASTIPISPASIPRCPIRARAICRARSDSWATGRGATTRGRASPTPITRRSVRGSGSPTNWRRRPCCAAATASPTGRATPTPDCAIRRSSSTASTRRPAMPPPMPA